MHPEVVRDMPGPCPLCGMALEPIAITADAEPDPELAVMSRRFWICAALAIPAVALSMLDSIPARSDSGDFRARRSWSGARRRFSPAPGDR